MIQPLINIAKTQAPLGDKALWLCVADNLVALVLHIQQGVNQQETCKAEVEYVLAQLPERGQTGVLEVSSDNEKAYFTRRSTCCFYYLKDGQKCPTCPKLPVTEKLERLHAYFAELR
jgi:ferric iron reductase protein FhuF